MDAEELTRSARFGTTRLDVAEWHAAALPPDTTLVDALTGMLTAATTRSLPPPWRGDYDRARANAWLEERDAESATLLAMSRATGAPVGLIILFELPRSDESELLDLRLGYLLAESAWGAGLGTELIAGLTDWCRATGRIRSIAGGVAPDNPASARVLVKNGFVPVGPAGAGDQIYKLDL